MVAIEYSPNSRASCQSCRCKISQGDVRVCVKAASPYQRGSFLSKYHHAECYTNRKDFTKLYGFSDLDEEDQKKYLTEEQKQQLFPQDHVDKENVDEENKKRKGDVKVKEKTEKKAKTSELPELQITITGLNYASVRAWPEQKVKLVREPDNKYDANAVRVDTVHGQEVGHVAKEQAARLSKILATMDESKFAVDATILTSGDGYKQSCKVNFTPVKPASA